MKEPDGIKSFDQLEQALKVEEKKETAKLFQETVSKRFENIPRGNFTSKIPGVKSMLFIPFRPSAENQRPQIHAVIHYETQDGGERNMTWEVFQDGTISGRMPGGVQFERKDLEQEIIYILEQACNNFWHETEIEIISGKDRKEEFVDTDEDTTKTPEKSRGVAGERLEFIRTIGGAVFGFYNKKVGLADYHAALFKRCAVLENPNFGNAAFVVPLLKPLEVEQISRERNPTQSNEVMDQETIDKLINEYWVPISRMARTRDELKDLGAIKIVHRGEKWKERMLEEIMRLEKVQN